MSTFAKLKKSAGSFASLASKVESEGKTSYSDDREWKIKVDKAGNGYAVIRFLPPCDGEEFPYIKQYTHAFKDPVTERWFIETCPTTVGGKCPVCEANSVLWNSGVELDKQVARARKRQVRYVSNILVKSCPSNREEEGKVFLYKYGPRIFQKIENAIKPQFEDEKPFNPFDFWNGADFKLKAITVNKQRNYDQSAFDRPAVLFDDDEKLEQLWNSQYKLSDLVEIKSYEELAARLAQVTAGDTASGNPAERGMDSLVRNTTVSKARDEEPPFDVNDSSSDDDDLSAYADLLAG